MAPSLMIATVALSALKYAAAFQPASPTFARRAASALRASDNDFDDFSSKVSLQYHTQKTNVYRINVAFITVSVTFTCINVNILQSHHSLNFSFLYTIYGIMNK